MTFIARFRKAHRASQARGIPAFDMRDAGHLELEFAGSGGTDRDDLNTKAPSHFSWREDEPAQARRILPTPEPTPIRYFLDGTQRTLRGFYCDNLPLVAGLVGAGIVERNEDGQLALLQGHVAFKQFWIAPRDSGSEHMEEMIAILEADGEQVFDCFEPGRVPGDLTDFGGLLEHAYKRVGEQRKELEAELIARWHANHGGKGGVLVVDGSLRQSLPGVIGLVKSFTRNYLTGNELATLFRLGQGERTAAFGVTDSWRADTPILAWYQRHWDAAGRDPRHALIRLEISDNWSDRPEVDQLASWMLSERLPAARNDARWPTLLYPVHHLERILKSHLDSETRGWNASV